MNRELPASVAIVTVTKWRSERGDARTTVVGKITMQLADDNGASLVAPDAFVAFDHIASDGRHVSEAGELALWSTVASIVALSGPIRLTLASEAGAPIVVATAGAASPVGYSMSSDARSAFAKRAPTRGGDGVLTVPDDLDGRYFVAAPKQHQFASLRGDERFSVELTGWRCQRRLPGLSITASLTVGGRVRIVKLTPDLVVVNGKTRHLSLIARALVHGDATLAGHAVGPLTAARSSDLGDARDGFVEETVYAGNLSSTGGRFVSEETTDASSSTMALPAPFDLGPPSAGGPLSSAAPLPSVPATPFDAGFTPAKVVPGSGISQTMTVEEQMAAQLQALRSNLRQGLPLPPPSHPSAGPAPSVVPASSAAPPSSREEPRVAPPKPGVMATPRLKRK